MNHVKLIILLGIFVGVTVSQEEKDVNEKKVVCYYTNWSVYRPANDKFLPTSIDPKLCTHLIYAFAKFSDDNGLTYMDEYQDITKNGYKQFNELKDKNGKLKTLLSIGGWSLGSERFSTLCANQNSRAQFTQSAINLLRKYNFDGINLDWQYPGFRQGSRTEDKENYVKLTEDLRTAFEEEAKKTNRSRLLLTMSVPVETEYLEKGYDLHTLQEFADHLNVLSYDYHISSEPKVAHHSPLYPLPQDVEANKPNLNTDATIQRLLNDGLKKEKLILGIPTYGRSFKLQNKDEHGPGAPTKGPDANEAENRVQYNPYYKICQDIKDNNWTVEHTNSSNGSPFAYKDDNWIGYDDETSVYEKGKYAREKGLGGIMFWTIDDDDFNGNCGSQHFPLITAGREGLLGQPLSVNNQKVETAT